VLLLLLLLLVLVLVLVQADVMGVVHVGWATLDRRVREFTKNAASGLTITEFEQASEQHEQDTSQLLAQLVSSTAAATAAVMVAAAAAVQCCCCCGCCVVTMAYDGGLTHS